MANLAYGSSGNDVRALQQERKKAGYNIAADGVFGAETQAAVESYQRANGLGVDGIAGNQTLGSLGITSATPDPTKTSYYTGNSGKYQLGDWVGGDTYSGGGAAPAVSPASYTGMGGVSTGLTDYWNEGLTAAQVAEMQRYYGTDADGKWGPNSTAAAGGLNAQQAWQQYQQQTGAGGIPLMMGFEEFYNLMGGADFEKMLRGNINASVQQAVNSYEAQKQETEQDAQEMARQAYVAKLLGEKNMAQRLAAGGYAGGMAESAMLESETNYQNNLAEIHRQRQRALDEIQRAIDNARLTGNKEMAEQMTAYMAQVQSYYSDYYNQMLSQQMQQAQAAASAVTPSVTQSYTPSVTPTPAQSMTSSAALNAAVRDAGGSAAQTIRNLQTMYNNGQINAAQLRDLAYAVANPGK